MVHYTGTFAALSRIYTHNFDINGVNITWKIEIWAMLKFKFP